MPVYFITARAIPRTLDTMAKLRSAGTFTEPADGERYMHPRETRGVRIVSSAIVGLIFGAIIGAILAASSGNGVITILGAVGVGILGAIVGGLLGMLPRWLL